MKLELEFSPSEDNSPPGLAIVLDPAGESPTTGLPLVTKPCTTPEAFEAELQRIEKQLGKIRKEAAKFFKTTAKLD
jgi:hypothetical protein